MTKDLPWEEACQNGKWSLQNILKRQNAGGCERPTCFSLQFKRRTVVSRGTYLEVTGWTSVSRGCTRKRVSVDLSSHQLVPEYIWCFSFQLRTVAHRHSINPPQGRWRAVRSVLGSLAYVDRGSRQGILAPVLLPIFARYEGRSTAVCNLTS